MIDRPAFRFAIRPLLAGLPLLAALSVSPRSATADPLSGWVFDRLTWSPGGESLAVEAVQYRSRGDRFERGSGPVTLVVDARSGLVSAPAEARAFQLREETGEMLLLGSWGLWHFDPGSERLRQLHVSSPGGGARIYDFAFDAAGRPVFLVGAVGDTTGGLYRAGASGAPEFLAPFEPGSAVVPELWTASVRPGRGPQIADARGPRFFTIPGLDGDFRYDGRRLVRARATGTPELVADSVEISWASWPEAGGVGLVSVHELRQPGSGAVYRLRPDAPPRRILDSVSPQVAWRTPREAYLNDADGRLRIYDADRDALRAVDLKGLPSWAAALNEPDMLVTLGIERWPLSARDEGSRLAMIEKCEKDLRFGEGESPFTALLRAGEGEPRGRIEGAGFFPAPSSAEQVLPVLEKRGLKARVTMAPARRFWGAFDSGFLRNAAGDVAFVRRLDGSLPFTELWLRPSGGTPRRLITTRIGGS